MPRKTGKIVPRTVKAFSAKKEVTEKDAKKLKPLTKWLEKKVKSNDTEVFFMGFVTGACALFIVWALSV